MRFYLKILTISYLVFFSLAKTYAQDCKELLNEYFNSVNSLKRPVNKTVYFFDLQSKYYLWDDRTNSKTVNSKIYLSSEMYVIETDMYSLYSDKRDLYYVDNTTLQIRKYKVTDESAVNDNLTGIFSESQKELFEKGVFSNCSEIIYKNQKLKNIIIYATTELKEKYDLQQVEYLINPNSKKIVKAIIYYTDNYKFKRLEVEYLSFNLNYKNWKYKKASDLVFDSKGLLFPRLKNYRVIDKEE